MHDSMSDSMYPMQLVREWSRRNAMSSDKTNRLAYNHIKTRYHIRNTTLDILAGKYTCIWMMGDNSNWNVRETTSQLNIIMVAYWKSSIGRLLWPCRVNLYLHMQVDESILVAGFYYSVGNEVRHTHHHEYIHTRTHVSVTVPDQAF
jgi:hypothetical protein